MSAQAAIERALHRYALALDENDMATLGDCFTEDAELVTAIARLTGRAPIIERYARIRGDQAQRGEQPRHLTTNILVEQTTEGEAHVKSYFLLATATDGHAKVAWLGTYADHMVEDGGVWRFKRRQIVVEGTG